MSAEASGNVSAGVTKAEATAKYAASYGFQDFNQRVASKSMERFEMASYCLVYQTGFFPAEKLQPTAPFKAACERLQAAHKTLTVAKSWPRLRELWFEFFRTWGAHYAHEVKLGGKMVHTIDVDDAARSAASKSKIGSSARGQRGGVRVHPWGRGWRQRQLCSQLPAGERCAGRRGADEHHPAGVRHRRYDGGGR